MLGNQQYDGAMVAGVKHTRHQVRGTTESKNQERIVPFHHVTPQHHLFYISDILKPSCMS